MATEQQRQDIGILIGLVKKYSRPYWKEILLLVALNFSVTAFSALMTVWMAPIMNVAFGMFGQAPAARGGWGAGFSLNALGETVTRWLPLAGAGVFTALAVLACLYALSALLRGAATFGAYLVALKIRSCAARDMQRDLFAHILSLPMSFFVKHRTGELISRVEKDTISTTSGLADNILAQSLTSPLLVCVYGFLLVRTNYMLAVVGIVGGICQFLISKGVSKPIRRYFTDQFSVFAELSARLQETLLSIRVVKSFAAEKFELARLGEEIKKVVRINMKLGVVKHIEEPLRTFANTLIEVLTLLFAIRELLAGRISAPAFFMFIYVCKAIMEPMAKFFSIIPVVQSVIASADNIGRIFAITPEIKDGHRAARTFEREIALEKVSFSYDTRPVLRDCTLTIRKGETVALVGPSGAGKSTLADLLLRFYDPASGRITMDGVDLREFDQASYRRLFGVVSQESLLFNASIRDNIRYGRDTISEEQIREAASMAYAHDFIMQTPRGYDTMVGDRGIRLSGGQRQRIAIARAIVHRPQVLILDEATSALDSESELMVQRAIENVVKSCTAVVIAHRLSTVMRATTIVVMDKGEMVSKGSHEFLLENCALYERLCALQFGAHV